MLGETDDHPQGDRGTIDHQAMGDWCSVSCNLFLRFVTGTLSSGARVQSFTVDSRTCPKVSGFQLRTSAKNRRLLRVSEILNSSAQRRNQTMRFLASAPSSDVWSGPPPAHRRFRIRSGAKSDWCHRLILHSCAVRGRWARCRERPCHCPRLCHPRQWIARTPPCRRDRVNELNKNVKLVVQEGAVHQVLAQGRCPGFAQTPPLYWRRPRETNSRPPRPCSRASALPTRSAVARHPATAWWLHVRKWNAATCQLVPRRPCCNTCERDLTSTTDNEKTSVNGRIRVAMNDARKRDKFPRTHQRNTMNRQKNVNENM